MSSKKRYSLIPYGYNLLKIKAVIGGREKGYFERITWLLNTGSSFTLILRKILSDLNYNLTQTGKTQQIITGGWGNFSSSCCHGFLV